jgi:hypothetical protein
MQRQVRRHYSLSMEPDAQSLRDLENGRKAWLASSRECKVEALPA